LSSDNRFPPAFANTFVGDDQMARSDLVPAARQPGRSSFEGRTIGRFGVGVPACRRGYPRSQRRVKVLPNRRDEPIAVGIQATNWTNRANGWENSRLNARASQDAGAVQKIVHQRIDRNHGAADLEPAGPPP
jgi:hypothetical protein